MIRATRVAILAAGLAAAVPAAAKERSEIPERYKWKLTDLYPSDEAWRAGRDDLAKRIPALAAYKGKLGDSAEALRRALDTGFGVRRDLERLVAYASARSDEDTRVAATREMRQAAEQLAVELSSATSFVRPELLSLDPAKIRGFLSEEKGLAQYRFYLEDVLRWRPHTLGAGEERVAADAGDLEGIGGDVFGVLTDADLPWPTVKLSTGEEVRLDSSGFSFARASRAREDRDRVFASFFGALKAYERTIGAALYGTARAHIFEKKVRSFGSSMESSLFRDDIPPAVYRQLLADVSRNLPAFHRYLALRKRMLGVDRLRYQDLYVPLVGSVDLKFSPDEARAIVLAAFAPLGKEYGAALAKGFESGWTDYLPSTGKRSGAYSINTGVYGVHPYQLLNFNGLYEDLSALAHESGHSMHTYLADSTQPYATHETPIFVAEVASTLNENLLLHHMLGRAKDDATRLALLGNALDRMRGTLFRQTQFAEFELRLHEKAEKGETLTGENLSALYLDVTRRYYGHDKGVCEVPDLIAVEWGFVPHFHRDFYVYQYATSYVASTSLARAIREEAKRGKTKARDAFLALLRAGGSKYPVDLLRDAGVDMTTSRPFDAAIAEMNGIMDEMDAILARQEKAKGAKKR
ncbi:MAG TPA: oligoendopeptidase F [Anaeromyxobacter sp.]